MSEEADRPDNGFRVRDRRWWSDEREPDPEPTRDDPPADSGEAPKEQEQAAPAVDPYVDKLRQELANRDRQLEEATARQRRAIAELERTKERIERDAARQLELSRRDLIRGLLELLDDLDRAIDAAGGSDRPLLEGVELVRRRFLGKLAELGVSLDDPTGQPFDPARHDALSAVPVTDPAQHGAIVGVIKKGYLIGDEVLRPAQVAVGRAA